ncbi:MAG: glycosyltransferase family 2 protein [Aureispira sp.]|nr:glycosyltransferase family 2 protein [Aureispira sp.]
MMNEQQHKLVTIVIPAFNRADLIPDTLDSILAQEHSNWECILVDDGSTDDTPQVIQSYVDKDARFQLHIRARGPKGAPTCRNIGIEKASGEFIMFLDSDDLLIPTTLSGRLAKIYKEPKADFVVYPMGQFKNKIGDDKVVWNLLHTNEGLSDFDRFLRKDVVWSVSGGFFRASFIKEHTKGFTEGVFAWQDWEFNLRSIFHAEHYVKATNEDLDNYLRNQGQVSISKPNDNPQRTAEKILNRIDIIQKIFKHVQPSIKNKRQELYILTQFYWSLFDLNNIEGYESTIHKIKDLQIEFKFLKKRDIQFWDFYLSLECSKKRLAHIFKYRILDLLIIPIFYKHNVGRRPRYLFKEKVG